MTENEISDFDLLELELAMHGLVRQDAGFFLLNISGEQITKPFEECINICENEAEGLNKELWNAWQKLAHIAESMVSEPEYNDSSSLANILFLHSLKEGYLFSLLFDDLMIVSQKLKLVYNCDISHIDERFIDQFNELYLGIKTLHNLLMKEMYRIEVAKKYMSIAKIASISGPWSNLDLPLKERVWQWYGDGDEEWFNARTRARQKQTRYNPEYDTVYGFYYVWVELRSRNTYRLGDPDERVYPSRLQISMP